MEVSTDEAPGPLDCETGRTYGLRMAEMSMNKAIHGAFRRDLDRFIAALRAFGAGNRARAA